MTGNLAQYRELIFDVAESPLVERYVVLVVRLRFGLELHRRFDEQRNDDALARNANDLYNSTVELAHVARQLWRCS